MLATSVASASGTYEATLRVYAGKPSYVPGKVYDGGGTVNIGSWGDNPRTMVFSKTGETSVTLTWEVDEDGALIWSFSS